MRKCILVCANCHRGIHYGHIAPPKESVFLEDVAQELIKKNEEFYSKALRYCSKCGAEITYKASMCMACRGMVRRKAERPSREEFKSMVRSLAFTEIGKKYGVSGNTIKKWCRDFGLPSNKKVILSYSQENWE